MKRAVRVAAQIKQELDVSAELVKGSGGIFEVQVDGDVVAKKTREHGFPEDDAVVDAVRAATQG
ncbi:MAG: Rdx family protein [Myxococcota bacterium]